MKVQMTFEAPDIVGGALLRSLPDCEKVHIIPDTILPGYVLKLVEAKEVD